MKNKGGHTHGLLKGQVYPINGITKLVNPLNPLKILDLSETMKSS